MPDRLWPRRVIAPAAAARVHPARRPIRLVCWRVASWRDLLLAPLTHRPTPQPTASASLGRHCHWPARRWSRSTAACSTGAANPLPRSHSLPWTATSASSGAPSSPPRTTTISPRSTPGHPSQCAWRALHGRPSGQTWRPGRPTSNMPHSTSRRSCGNSCISSAGRAITRSPWLSMATGSTRPGRTPERQALA